MPRAKHTIQPALAPPPPPPAPEPVGIRCPSCGCGHLPVAYVRHKPDGRTMRVRECRHCARRMVTFERVAGTSTPA